MKQYTSKRNKQLAYLFVGLFIISLAFPITASIINIANKIYPGAGSIDVGVAFVCFITFVLLSSANKLPTEGRFWHTTHKMGQYMFTLPLLLIVLFFMKPDLNWQVLLIGLGWRSWLLFMALPHLVAALGKHKSLING